MGLMAVQWYANVCCFSAVNIRVMRVSSDRRCSPPEIRVAGSAKHTDGIVYIPLSVDMAEAKVTLVLAVSCLGSARQSQVQKLQQSTARRRGEIAATTLQDDVKCTQRSGAR